MALQQSRFPQDPDMHVKEEVVKCNETPECNNIEHTLDKKSTNIEGERTRHPQALTLIRERQAQSPEENVASSFSTPDGQSLRNSPFQARLSPNSPGVTSSPGSYVSANNSGVTPSAGRDFSRSSSGVNPSPGGSVSLGSLGVSPSLGRHQSPISPDVSPSPGRHVSPTSPDVTPSSGRDFCPSSPDITPSSGRYPSPSDATPSSGRYLPASTSGVTPSPRRDDSSHSEVETNASDSGSVGSLSPQRPLRQHCKFCHGQNLTRGHVSESSSSESTSSSSSHPSNSSCAFCCEDVNSCGKEGTSGTMADQNLQPDSKPLIETLAIKDGVCGRTPSNHLPGMGLCSFDSNGHYGNEAQYPSRSVQQREASMSSHLPVQDHIVNPIGARGHALVEAKVQDSRRSATNKTTALSSSLPRDESAFAQGGVSPPQQQAHAGRGSHVTLKENAELVPSSAKLSPVARHRLPDLPLQNGKDGSITGPLTSKPSLSKGTVVSSSVEPAAPPAVSVDPSPSNAVAPLMQKPSISPSTPKPLLSPPAVATSHPTIRPGMQQSLLRNSPNWPGQHQHVPPLMENLLAFRFQQPGFPGHQFRNAPFVPPGVFNPAMFQGWDTNALIQQQLLASRLPFGLPFHAMQNPAQRFRPPAGGRGIRPANRGRYMAPRFHNPGVVNNRNCGDLEKINTVKSSTLPPEQTSSVDNTSETQKDKEGKNRSTSSDGTTSQASPSPAPSSPDNTESRIVESRSRESTRIDSASGGSCPKSGIKPSWSPSSTTDLSPENISDTMPNQSREETGWQGFLPGQGSGKYEPVSGERQVHTLSPTSSLPKQEGDSEGTGTKKISPSKMSPSELLLKEQKVNV